MKPFETCKESEQPCLEYEKMIDHHSLVDEIVNRISSSHEVVFSDSALIHLRDYISQHISDLIVESIKTSQRDGTDNVSSKHVRIAKTYLIGQTNKEKRYSIFEQGGKFGGILFGSGASYFLSLINANTFNRLGFVVAVRFVVVGVVLLALDISKNSDFH
jgi:hypothetical protein